MPSQNSETGLGIEFRETFLDIIKIERNLLRILTKILTTDNTSRVPMWYFVQFNELWEILTYLTFNISKFSICVLLVIVIQSPC